MPAAVSGTARPSSEVRLEDVTACVSSLVGATEEGVKPSTSSVLVMSRPWGARHKSSGLRRGEAAPALARLGLMIARPWQAQREQPRVREIDLNWSTKTALQRARGRCTRLSPAKAAQGVL